MSTLESSPNKLRANCPCGADVYPHEGLWVPKLKQVWCKTCWAKETQRVGAAGQKKAETAELPASIRPKVRLYWNQATKRVIARTLERVSVTLLETFKACCESGGCSYEGGPAGVGYNTSLGNVPELIRILEKSGLRVEVSDNLAEALNTRAVETKSAVAGAGVRIAASATRGKRLKDYQKIGVEFLVARPSAILGDDIGCVDGEAIVQVCRAKRSFKTTLARLCHKFNGGASGRGWWDPSFPTYVKALVGDHLRLHEIERVVDKGVRPVVKLTLVSGKTLRLTTDHEVCVSTRHGFVAVSDLKPGDSVITNGRPKCKLCGSTNRVATYERAKFPGFCHECIYRRLRRNTIGRGHMLTKDGYKVISAGMRYHPYMLKKAQESKRRGRTRTGGLGGVLEHRLVVEANMNGVTLDQWLEICRTNTFERKHVFLGDELVVHHKNENPTDNRIENLEVMTEGEHAVRHGREGGFLRMNGARGGKGGLVQFIPLEDKVASVEPDGETRVYDIVCKDPWRNFVANGVVVHNCGKSAQFLKSIPANGRAMIVAPKIVLGSIVKGRPVGGWAEEASIWRPDLRVAIFRKMTDFRWPEPGELCLLNYELMPVTGDEIAKAVAKATKRRQEVLKKGVDPKNNPEDKKAQEGIAVKRQRIAPEPPAKVVLAIDEAHALANGGSLRSGRFRHMAFRVLANEGRVVAITATPVKNEPKELWSVLECIGAAQTAFGSFQNYANLHDYKPVQVGRDKVKWEFGEPSPEVAERLRRVMIRRRKRDVLTELPPLTVRRLVIDVDRDAIKACDAAMSAIEKAGLNVEQAMEIVDEARGGLDFKTISRALEALARAKAPHVLERIAEYERAGTPIVVFAAHLAIVETLGARKGWGALVGGDRATANLTGTPQHMKGPEVAKLFWEKKLDNVSATIQYAGAGLNGLQRANELLLAEKLWNPAMNSQAIGRIERLGQEQAMTVTDFVANHPLDLRMSAVLERKLDLYAATIDAAAVAPEDLTKREDVAGDLTDAARRRRT